LRESETHLSEAQRIATLGSWSYVPQTNTQSWSEECYRLLGLYGIARASEVRPKAQASVDRALAIDPNQPEALATLAIIASVFDWDLVEMRRRSDRALAADPNHVRALGERATSVACLETTGDPQPASAPPSRRRLGEAGIRRRR